MTGAGVLTYLHRLLREAGSEQPAEAAELLVSEAAADLPSFLASTSLRGELLECVRRCAVERVLHAPVVSFKALERARGTLEDFARTYFPLHGLDTFAFMRFLPALCFVEAAIYEADEKNESLVASGGVCSEDMFASSLTPVLGVLEARGWLSESVLVHMRSGQTYWALERSICSAILAGGPVSESQVLRAHELKSFDYRLLNSLLYALRGVAPDQHVMDFLFVDELLTDIADDLFDYEDDVLRGSFNILRCFVYLHGANAEGRLAARISELEAQHHVLLSKLDESSRRAFEERMAEVFSRPGTRSWQIPPLIIDEAAYRADVLSDEADDGRGPRAQRSAATLHLPKATPRHSRSQHILHKPAAQQTYSKSD